jgi:hypothetical protein
MTTSAKLTGKALLQKVKELASLPRVNALKYYIIKNTYESVIYLTFQIYTALA